MKILDKKLEFIRSLQEKYPTSHIGGSIGLLMHGYNLRDDYTHSDIDMTVDSGSKALEDAQKDSEELMSDVSEFDYRIATSRSGVSMKVDVKVDPTQKYNRIIFEGHQYNVTNLETIIKYKELFAERGVQKHIDDLHRMFPHKYLKGEFMKKTYKSTRPILWFTSGTTLPLEKLEKYFTAKGIEELIEYGFLKEIEDEDR
jgi:hypothetical protein